VASDQASGATLVLVWDRFPLGGFTCPRVERAARTGFLQRFPPCFGSWRKDFFVFPDLCAESRWSHDFPAATEFPHIGLLLAQFLIFCSVSFSPIEDPVPLCPALVIDRTRAVMLLTAGSPFCVDFPVCCRCSSSCSNFQSLLFSVLRQKQ
jgi:hypothetical protein